MIGYIIALVGSVAPMWEFVLTHVLCLAVVATVPCIIRKVVAIHV